MVLPTVTEFNEGKEDLDDLEAIVNGFVSVATRLGGTKQSLSQLLSNVTHGAITAYSPTTTYTGITEWVSYVDTSTSPNTTIVYRPIPSALPIAPVSPLDAAPDTSKWTVAAGYKPGDKLNNPVETYSELDNLPVTGLPDGAVVKVTGAGIAGDFVLGTDTASPLAKPGNVGTIRRSLDDSNRYWERTVDGNVIEMDWFGALGDWDDALQTGTDDTSAILAAIAYCQPLGTHGYTLSATSGAKYRYTAQLTINSPFNFKGNNCRFYKDFAGGGIVLGRGAGTNEAIILDSFQHRCSTAQTASAYTPASTEFGFQCNGARYEIVGDVKSIGHRGICWDIIDNNNSNQSHLDISAGSGGRQGVMLSGSGVENLANFTGTIRTDNCYGAGFDNDGTTTPRSWDVFIYSEGDARDPAATYAQRLNNFFASRIFSYSEQPGGSDFELQIEASCVGCIITDGRNNRINNLSAGGNFVYGPPGLIAPEQSVDAIKKTLRLYRNSSNTDQMLELTTAAEASYMRIVEKGSSGFHEIQAKSKNSANVMTLNFNPESDSFRITLSAGVEYNFSDNRIFLGGAASVPSINFGSGTPESVVTANVGSTFHRSDGGAGTSYYVKESGTGNTGWVAK
jgi:hypothetical protein